MAGKLKNKEELKQLYKYFMQIFKETDIKIIAFYGTLLGIIRENSFIENDDDIDVIINRKDFHKLQLLIKNKNIKTGLYKKKIIQLFYNNIGPFDIYIYDECIKPKDHIVIMQDNNLIFTKSSIFPLKKIKFNDYEIFIPNNSKQILEEIYGSSYMIPNKKYIWRKSRILRLRSKIRIRLLKI